MTNPELDELLLDTMRQSVLRSTTRGLTVELWWRRGLREDGSYYKLRSRIGARLRHLQLRGRVVCDGDISMSSTRTMTWRVAP